MVLMSMEPWAAARKLYGSVKVPPAPVRVTANSHLPRISRQSRLSTNDKGDEIVPGAVHGYSGIYLTAEENPGKLQLEDRR